MPLYATLCTFDFVFDLRSTASGPIVLFCSTSTGLARLDRRRLSTTSWRRHWSCWSSFRGTPAVGVSQTLRRSTEGATLYIRQGGHHWASASVHILVSICRSYGMSVSPISTKLCFGFSCCTSYCFCVNFFSVECLCLPLSVCLFFSF